MLDLSVLSSRPVFFDGATGTMLQKYGLPAGKLGETFNIERPNTVLRLHKSYLRAGADIIKSNTFCANELKEEAIGYPVSQVVCEGVALARRAVTEMKKGLVAFDIGPLGVLLEPMGKMKFEDAVAIYKKTIKAGADNADLILFETMSDLYEIKAAIIAAKECCDLPIFVTATFDERGKMLCGADAETFALTCEGLGAAAVGLNCGFGPDIACGIVKKLAKVVSVPLIANPNAGLPIIEGETTSYTMTPTEFGYAMAEIIASGAQMIGGCCGTTPDHISSAYGCCSHNPPARVTDKGLCAVTSYGKTVIIGADTPVMIGERINPTGKPKLKAALRAGETDYIISEALSQIKAGADILDVNVGIPDIDEKARLCDTVKAIQKVCAAPLQLDTANPAAMEEALRHYNGKPMVNSVNGSKKSLLSVIPLVKKYGGVMVALTLDEKGIPDTVEGRVKIASRIIKVAEACGIARKNIVFDTLAMTVAASAESARLTLESMAAIKETFGVQTVLGISNVSYGLPERDLVNSVFLTEAFAKGLSGAIMNPLSEQMRRTFLARLAILGMDKNCEKYIACVSEANGGDTVKGLSDAIVKGLADKAAEFAAEELLNKAPSQVIDEAIIPALNTVGQDFEKGKIFLPSLLTAAEASEAAFAKIKEALNASGGVRKIKGKIILATVKGDIHDLGKNIVKAMLSNYGYEVIDLGKDVESEAIAEAVVNEKVPLVGLSALMTTTAPAMAEAVKAIKAVAPECKIMVGGAVITSEYAEKIGADIYAKDAVAAVRAADGVFAK